jgi:hypothetical protein
MSRPRQQVADGKFSGSRSRGFMAAMLSVNARPKSGDSGADGGEHLAAGSGGLVFDK